MTKLVDMLPEYITEAGGEEIKAIALVSLGEAIRNAKMDIARALIQAKSAMIMDNMDRANQMSEQAHKIQNGYQQLLEEYKALGGNVTVDTQINGHVEK